MFEHTPSDRVRVVPLGQLQPPAACALCGNGTDQMGFLHTDVWYDYEGYVYFCLSNCARQLAEAFGCLLPEEAEILKDQATKIAEHNKELEEQLNDANTRLAAWDSLLAQSLANSPAGSDLSQDPEPSDEDSEKHPKRTSRRTNAGKSESKESAAKQGSNDSSQSQPSIVL